MEESRKLKRGLKDISALFAEKAEPVLQRPAPRLFLPEASIQLISLAHPAMPPAFPLYHWMAEQTLRAGVEATVISLDSGKARYPEGARHRHMNLSEFEKNCSRIKDAENGPGSIAEAALLLLDFSWGYPAVFEKALLLLDKIVFWATPEMEALSQVYKWIKTASLLNSRLEFLLAYDGEDEKKGSYLFESFSEMISRRLGLDLSWLGCCPVLPVPAPGWRLNLDLLLSSANPLTQGEKRALVHSMLMES